MGESVKFDNDSLLLLNVDSIPLSGQPPPMVFEGLKLMFAGMFVVYVFLSVLLVMIKVSARFFAGLPENPVGPPVSSTKNENGRIAAVIAAAVAAYRSGR